jgi:hypothetical protein
MGGGGGHQNNPGWKKKQNKNPHLVVESDVGAEHHNHSHKPQLAALIKKQAPRFFDYCFMD